MFRTLISLACLLSATSAHATTTACFGGTGGEDLQGMRVTYATWWGAYELETDSSGCVDIPTARGVSSAWITIHATNRVVQMVNAGVPVADTRSVSHGAHYVLSADHTLAERLRRLYDDGFRGYGPFTGSSPIGGSLAAGPYISADLGSPLVVTLPYVEPLPVGPLPLPPRLHLRATDTGGSTPAHELAHALHISQWPDTLKGQLELYYLNWLTTPNNVHYWDGPSTDVVAFVEAFGAVGEVFEDMGSNGTEADFLTRAADKAEDLRNAAPGDPTIEGVVFGVLFDQFATSVGLDYVIDTYISCEVLTLDDYATCIHDREGGSSAIFGALRDAGLVYGVQFSSAPHLGDASFCSSSYRCGVGQGDCDSDSQCDAGLVCTHDVGGWYGFSSATDVCELPEGHADKCTPDTPCRAGSGDCDTDADCLFPAYCAANQGADYGLASWVDVCEYQPIYVISR